MCSGPNTKGCRETGRRGFTLIELMVSLVLLSIVMSLVYGAFAQISGSALAQRDRLNEQQELRLLMRLISDDLLAAQWLEQYWAKGERYRTGIVATSRLEGGKEFTRISFHAARPTRFFRTVNPAQDPRLHEVGYQVVENEERTDLVLQRREDFYIDDELEEGGQVVEVAEGIKTFLIEFLPQGADPNAIEPQWERRWDSPFATATARMPLAIRLTIERLGPFGSTLSESLEMNLPGSLRP